MSILGISSYDLKDAGWNIVVTAGLTASSALLAKGIRKTTLNFFNRIPPPRDPHLRSGKVDLSSGISLLLSLAAGAGTAWYLNSKISTSSFALIKDLSRDKMLKLGVLQAAVGLGVDLALDMTIPVFAVLGAGLAAPDYWNRYSMMGFGAVGAFMVVGK